MESHFERIIAQNRLKTYAVLGIYIVIFILIGLLADIIRINANSLQEGFSLLLSFNEFPLITFGMALVACGIVAFSIAQFSRIMLSGNEYKRINPSNVLSRTESMLYRNLQDLLKKANLSFEPALYIIEAPYMNAFASGWNASNSLIAITSALIERLNEDEIKAVMAHELSHIRHGDVRLTMCVGILSNIMLLGVNIFAFYFSSANSQGARAARGILLILQFILPLFTLVLSLFISRNREYMADSGAAYLMGDSAPMIRALQKISQDYAQNRYVEPNPTRENAYLFDMGEVLSTHPSTQNRIKALLGQHYS
ncbi:zinc metalloprotease HtpX [Helicobacter jaachi]|uniref:Zinc metalloprotease HtpX n=1 Tax=Helicobacter jaachi TaxID=1677920 RepID=A0A4U8T6S0_9HELI|nr:zinc metalloprotease HtpX [Helicobacter jaachi]TLD95188.1 zinc metalloprotease HtpX [Helicobacter jaachi]